MSAVQHDGARRLLSIIKDAWYTKTPLTYESAAQALGRNKDHARAVAQMCDLLDAAAAFARVPFIALIVVTEKSGHINRKAFIGKDIPDGLKNRIVAHSKSWMFSEDDFEAIRNGLNQLSGLGNHAAWAKVRREVPSWEAFFGLIASAPIEPGQDAINDLGSDTPGIKTAFAKSYARDPRIRKEVERRSKGCCELCGKSGFQRPDGTKYIETHHIIALANEGEDRISNVIGLCPEHHREAHYGARQTELEREMIARVKAPRK